MANFNPEFIRALAHGDAQAHEEVNKLHLPVRMAIGTAVDQMRRDENIVPMNSGFSIYEQKKVTQEEQDALGNAIAERLQREKDAEELKEKIRQDHLEKEVKYRVERARASLTY